MLVTGYKRSEHLLHETEFLVTLVTFEEEKPEKEKSRRKVAHIPVRITVFPRFKQASKMKTNYFKRSRTVIVGFWGGSGIFHHFSLTPEHLEFYPGEESKLDWSVEVLNIYLAWENAAFQ